MRNPLFILALSLVLTACDPTGEALVPEDWDQLYREWTLVRLQDESGNDKVPNKVQSLSLTLSDSNRFSLVSSCNTGAGDFQILEDGGFQFGLIATTKIGCQDDLVAEWENRYLQALASVQEYGLHDGQLRLWSEEDKRYLHFE
ncbi:MAG: META domain-containing protein [Bacteroidota bacterium]